jgi:hypothetical protein
MADTLALHDFSMPVDMVTLAKAGSDDDGEWCIEGLASTPSLDQQNEVVMVKGLDLSYLEQGRGTFNWNHKGDADPSSIVGVITHCQRTPNGELLVKGKLLKSLPKAKHIYQLMKALAKDCPDRKMGMSIEGKVLARNGNQIVKAWVKAVALTLDPVNKDTWVNFAKSMEGMTWVEPSEENLFAGYTPEVLEEALAKTLSAGGSAVGGVNGGSILSPESLEAQVHDTGYDAEEPRKKSKRARRRSSEKMNKSYTYDEAVKRLRQLEPSLSDTWVEKIVRFTFDRLDQE